MLFLSVQQIQIFELQMESDSLVKLNLFMDKNIIRIRSSFSVAGL